MKKITTMEFWGIINDPEMVRQCGADEKGRAKCSVEFENGKYTAKFSTSPETVYHVCDELPTSDSARVASRG